MSRLSELLQRMPPATLAILGLNISVYLIFQLFLDIDIHQYTLLPSIAFKEPYRLVTSTVLHGSLMHIGMNMMSTLGLCAALEASMGTTSLLLTTMGSIVVTPSIHVGIAFVAHFLFGYNNNNNDWWQQHSLGFSGVLFHLSVLEAASSTNQSRSLFGMISVPSHLYPWALLILLQMFIPHLSFLGHLSGILAGTAQVGMGYAPHSAALEHRGRDMCGSTFVPSHNTASSVGGEQGMWRSSGNTTNFRHLCGTVFTYTGYVLETLQVIVFGRRRQQGNVEIVSLIGGDDDDDWVGLPVVTEEDEEDEDDDVPLESQVV
jgi:membrane associated rhomboid family serine protease